MTHDQLFAELRLGRGRGLHVDFSLQGGTLTYERREWSARDERADALGVNGTLGWLGRLLGGDPFGPRRARETADGAVTNDVIEKEALVTVRMGLLERLAYRRSRTDGLAGLGDRTSLDGRGSILGAGRVEMPAIQVDGDYIVDGHHRRVAGQLTGKPVAPVSGGRVPPAVKDADLHWYEVNVLPKDCGCR